MFINALLLVNSKHKCCACSQHVFVDEFAYK